MVLGLGFRFRFSHCDGYFCYHKFVGRIFVLIPFFNQNIFGYNKVDMGLCILINICLAGFVFVKALILT